MDSGVTGLAYPRRGHFDLATGFHGDLWLDLDALFLRPRLLRPQIRWLADRLRVHRVDAVCGPLEGGAFLAQAIAVPFYAAATVQSQAWPAAQCPLCAGGIPLTDPGAPAERLEGT